MKMSQWLIVSALMMGMAAPASAATTDPEVIIYRFPGVRDDGGEVGVGVATVFICTNFSGVAETIRLVTRRNDGMLVNNFATSLPHLNTATFATHPNPAYPTLFILTTGSLTGTAAIAATSTSVICTAMVIDAANPKPDGVALRGIRFNPAPGSQE
jgi:hypothetical protein